MAREGITWGGIGIRFLFALFLVFATYNPDEYSFYHWSINNWQSDTALTALIGVVLLIGWAIFIRATLQSLGFIGLILATAFFGSLIWVIIDWGIIPTDNIKLLTYIVLFIASWILATGISWSFIRRKISGQYDVVESSTDD